MPKSDYSFDHLVEKYSRLPSYDYIFVSTGFAGLGRLQHASSLDDLCQYHLEALLHSFPSSTLIIPSYSYTFGESAPGSLACFSKQTPSKIGPFSNYLINNKIGLRSPDPMVSVITIGPKQDSILKNLPNNSYGHDSIFARLLDTSTLCMSIGLGTNWTPFIHYLDYINMEPYRYDKLFSGYIQDDYKQKIKTVWNYSVPVRITNAEGNCIKLGKLAEYECLWTRQEIGRGLINSIPYDQYFEFALSQSKNIRWLTATGPPTHTEFPRQITSKQSDHNQTPNIESDSIPILGKPTRPLVGDCLSVVNKELINQLIGATVDHFCIHTGANIGGHVIPEAWIPMSLTIKAQNGDTLSVNDRNTLFRMVHEYSRSISINLSCLESIYSNNDCFIADPCLSCVEPIFALKKTYQSWLIERFKSSRPVELTFESQLHKSSVSFILLRNTKSSCQNNQVIVVDSLLFSDLKIGSLQNFLDQGFTLIIGPTTYSYHYSLLYLNSTHIYSFSSNGLDKLIIPRGMNPSDNRKLNKLETISYCLV
tara:strand:+ start:3743 stop:5350 length:1608 start_codon:yes stop_codon:yes gene_type:complete